MKMILAYTVDLAMPLVTQLAVTLIQEGDRAAHVIQVELKKGGQPFEADGLSVSGYFGRADGVRVALTGTVSQGVVSVELPDDCYTTPGMYAALIRIGEGHTQRTILRMAGRVEGEGTGPVVDTGHTIPTAAELKTMLETLERLETSLQDAAGAANTAAGAANDAAGRANTAAEGAEAWSGAEMALEIIPHGQQPSIEVTAGEAGQKQILIKMPMGPAGLTPKISVQAQTGEPGTEARVEMTGTAAAPILTFVIPQGLPGSGSVSTVCGVQPDGKGNVELTADKVGARSSSWMPTAQQVKARPESWTPTAQDVGARADDWMPTAKEVGAATSSAVAVTLTAEGWTGEAAPYTQTASVEGMTADAANVHAIVAPDGASFEAWGKAQVKATAQGAGTVTFEAQDKPAEALTANVLIIKGGGAQ